MTVWIVKRMHYMLLWKMPIIEKIKVMSVACKPLSANNSTTLQHVSHFIDAIKSCHLHQHLSAMTLMIHECVKSLTAQDGVNYCVSSKMRISEVFVGSQCQTQARTTSLFCCSPADQSCGFQHQKSILTFLTWLLIHGCALPVRVLKMCCLYSDVVSLSLCVSSPQFICAV